MADLLSDYFDSVLRGTAAPTGTMQPPAAAAGVTAPRQPFLATEDAVARAARLRALGAGIGATGVDAASVAAPVAAADAGALATAAAPAATGAFRSLLGFAGPIGAAAAIAPPLLGYIAGQSNPNYVPNNPTGFVDTAGGAATGVVLPVRTGAAGNVPPPSTPPLLGYPPDRASDWTLSDLIAGRARPATGVPAAAPAATLAPSAPDNFDLMGTPAPATLTDFAAAAPAREANAQALMQGIDARIGAGGANPDAINSRIASFRNSPASVQDFNDAQFQSGTGVELRRDGSGNLTFGQQQTAFPKVYYKADGTPTQNYNESEQFISGTARANADKAQLAQIESTKENDAALQRIYSNKSAVGRQQAISLYVAGLGYKGETAKLAQAYALGAAKLGIDNQRLVLDTLKGQAEIGDKNASAATKAFQLNAAIQTRLNGGSAAQSAAVAAGRAVPGGRFTVPGSALPGPNGELPVLDANSGALQVKKPVSEDDIKSTMRLRGMTREQVVAQLRARGQM